MPFDDLIEMLKQKIGQNIDEAGAKNRNFAQLALKRMHNPDYVPTPEETQKEQQTYQDATNTAMGTIQGPANLANEASPAKAALNNLYNKAAANGEAEIATLGRDVPGQLERATDNVSRELRTRAMNSDALSKVRAARRTNFPSSGQ